MSQNSKRYFWQNANTNNLVRINTLLSLLGIASILALSACGSPPPLETQVEPVLQSTPANQSTQEPGPQIHLQDCQLSAPGSSRQIAARCGTLSVLEDPRGGSARISLNIAVIPAVSRSPAPDPLFFLTGGPGQAATESFPLLASAFDGINAKHDIVLFDQRGTGGSNALVCAQTEFDPALETIDTRAEVQACLAGLEAQPEFYTTAIAMADLDQVREALGYAQINLYGLSYGSRAALSYLKLYPDRVRSMILDGVVPQDELLGSHSALDAQRALDLIFARCAGSSACAAAFPDVHSEFEALLGALHEEPVQVHLAHPLSGEQVEITFRAEDMANTIRLLSYSPETAALLPLLIHQAHSRQEYAPLAAQFLIIAAQLSESISAGMNFSVICAEDVPFYDEVAIRRANEGAYLGETQIDQLVEICSIWPRGEIPPGFKEPVVSEAPVLLLSGEADPVTPPENGAQVAQTLSNSLHLVIPGQGHNVIYRGCLPRLATDFIEQASVANLNTLCIEQINPMPFFLNPSGPYRQP